MSAPLLTGEGLTVAIGGHEICRSLELEIRPGECWAILGRNGAGKTTLLHTLAGLRSPQAGRVLLAGIEIATLPRRRVAQQLGLLPQIADDAFPGTVLETALLGRHPYLGRWQWEGPEDYAVAEAALSAVGLEGFAARQLITLSGGERQRAALATLLTQDPALLLLDEPTNHLDLHHQVTLLDRLHDRARARGQALVMILHDVNLALRYCDHVLLLFDGGETAAGERQSVLDRARLERLYAHPLIELQGPAGPVYLPR